MHKNDWASAGATNIGTVRKVNEDNFLDASAVGMWCVADGMGGHAKGDLASQMIVDYLGTLNRPELYPLSAEQIKEQLHAVNMRLLEISETESQGRLIGSTVVVLIFDQYYAHCIWAGDSRIYRLRNNELQQLTRDHSQVEEMVQAGLLAPEKAESHPASHVVTRAVGAHYRLEVDLLSFPLQENDVFMLCSDGLNKVVSSEKIAELLNVGPLNNTPETLINMALEHQALDNITVVTVCKQSKKNTEYPLISNVHLDETLPVQKN
ncbi:MAG: serine/threonine protein phosphatase PrpC [Paraglaciecola sp.]|jgi:serine/threonine protein phosphatase PrpC